MIGTEHGPRLELCDEHFDEVRRAGLVTDPYIGRDEFERRTGRTP